jgi:hypothetical protein
MPNYDPLAQIDILYLAWNRRAFTEASLKALQDNTDWSRVRALCLYCDGIGEDDGTRKLMAEFTLSVPHPEVYFEFAQYRGSCFGGPIEIMNHYLRGLVGCKPAPWFAKIDNDVIVPPGWLQECLLMLRENPSVDLLGIEAVCPPAMPHEERAIIPTDHIGGIGLMRTACFTDLPVPDGRLGFSDWQIKHDVVKAWLNPGLPVILLDRLPFEPWASLSKEYERKGWQRAWRHYTEADKALWSWWRE